MEGPIKGSMQNFSISGPYIAFTRLRTNHLIFSFRVLYQINYTWTRSAPESVNTYIHAYMHVYIHTSHIHTMAQSATLVNWLEMLIHILLVQRHEAQPLLCWYAARNRITHLIVVHIHSHGSWNETKQEKWVLRGMAWDPSSMYVINSGGGQRELCSNGGKRRQIICTI
jgi:hypothetical protein